MEDKSEIAIVIDVYNGEEYIADAIDSALWQTIPCKVIVADDGSTDRTKEIVSKYPVTYLWKENGGQSASTRNFGIKNSTEKFILPLDGDDILLPEYAELAYDYLIDHPDIDIVTSDAIKFGEESGGLGSSTLTEEIRHHNTMLYCSMFRRSFYDKVGSYEEDLPAAGVEDWVMWAKGYLLGAKAYKLEGQHWKYRVRKGGLSAVSISPKMEKINAWMKEKGYAI